MADTDDIDLSEAPTSTETASAETKTIIDPATGEPTLAKPEAVEGEPPVVEAKKEPEKGPDVDAVLALSAKTNRENRELKKKLETIENELKSLKETKPDTSLSEKAALADAIIKNPSLLLKHGWVEDKLMKQLLDPDSAVGPITQDQINQMIADAVAKATQESPEAKKRREEQESEGYRVGVDNATKYTTGKITEAKKDFYYVHEDDARGIVERILKHCNEKNIKPTNEEGDKLIAKAIKALHEKREAKFGKRQPAPSQQTTEQSPVSNEALGFTERRFAKPQVKIVTPQHTAPQNTGTPLPTRRAPIEIGFTSE